MSSCKLHPRWVRATKRRQHSPFPRSAVMTLPLSPRMQLSARISQPPLPQWLQLSIHFYMRHHGFLQSRVRRHQSSRTASLYSSILHNARIDFESTTPYTSERRYNMAPLITISCQSTKSASQNVLPHAS